MANHKSALKRHRQSLKRRAINRSVKTRIRNCVKAVRAAVVANNQSEAQEALVAATSALDRAANKSIIHAKTAARSISRLQYAINKITAA